MNLLLVDTAELDADARCMLRDRRAEHLRSVLGATVGSRVRAGGFAPGTDMGWRPVAMLRLA